MEKDYKAKFVFRKGKELITFTKWEDIPEDFEFDNLITFRIGDTMPEVTRVGLDSHVGHASPTPNPFHQTAYATGSDNVFVNGAKCVRVTDTTSCGDPATAGSATVFVNGLRVHRKGDATGGHGSWVPNASAAGSANVFAGP